MRSRENTIGSPLGNFQNFQNFQVFRTLNLLNCSALFRTFRTSDAATFWDQTLGGLQKKKLCQNTDKTSAMASVPFEPS